MNAAGDPYVLQWFKAFLLTALIEVPVVVWLYRQTPATLSAPRRAAVAFFAQLASHPMVWFVIPTAIRGYRESVVVAEVWAVLSETALYAVVFGGTTARALGVAFAANALSFAGGLALRAITGGWV